MLATHCSALCCPLETNFWWFQISTVDERHSSTQKMLSVDFLKGFECWLIMFWLNELLQVTTSWSLVASNSVTFFSTDERSSFFMPPQKTQQLSSTFESYWVLTDHVSFGWGDAGWNQVICCKQFGDFFLDRWEVFVLHPSTKNPDSCQALFEFYCLMTDDILFEWGYTSYNQVISCKQFGDFFLDRWEVFVLHPSTKNPDSCQALSEFYCLMTDDILFEWGYTSYNQVISCKQFGDFFLDRWEVFILHSFTKTLTAVEHFLNFIDWWLIMSHLSELLQVTIRSSAVSNSVTFFWTNERCSFFIPPQKPWQLSSTFWILLLDDWWYSVWMRLYKLQPGHQL